VSLCYLQKVNGLALFNLSANETSQLTDVWRLTNGQWLPQTQFPIKELVALNMNAIGDGWAVGENGTLVKVSSSSWQRQSNSTQANLLSVSLVSSDEAWVVGERGTILHYQQENWTSVSIG